MQETTYQIYMYTPLGKKSGKMCVKKTGNALEGWLNILQHNEPFEGTVDEMGNCRISGSFITLMRTVSFVAVGKILDSTVCMYIRDGRNVFELSGTVCREEEDIP